MGTGGLADFSAARAAEQHLPHAARAAVEAHGNGRFEGDFYALAWQTLHSVVDLIDGSGADRAKAFVSEEYAPFFDGLNTACAQEGIEFDKLIADVVAETALQPESVEEGFRAGCCTENPGSLREALSRHG